MMDLAGLFWCLFFFHLLWVFSFLFITVSSNQLKSIPSSLIRMRRLASLNGLCFTTFLLLYSFSFFFSLKLVSDNLLTTIPVELCSHPSLEQFFGLCIVFLLMVLLWRSCFKLTVANNRITSLPDQFSNLSNLSVFDCSGNCLRSIPHSLRLVPHLEFYSCLSLLFFLIPFCWVCFLIWMFFCLFLFFTVSHNKIEELSRLFFLAPSQSTIVSLSLSHNCISLLPVEVSMLSSLSILFRLFSFQTAALIICFTILMSVNNNNLESLPETLAQLTNLSELHCS